MTNETVNATAELLDSEVQPIWKDPSGAPFSTFIVLVVVLSAVTIVAVIVLKLSRVAHLRRLAKMRHLSEHIGGRAKMRSKPRGAVSVGDLEHDVRMIYDYSWTPPGADAPLELPASSPRIHTEEDAEAIRTVAGSHGDSLPHPALFHQVENGGLIAARPVHGRGRLRGRQHAN